MAKKPISDMPKDLAKLTKSLQKFKKLVFNTTKDLANWSTGYMQSVIESNIKRKPNTGTLAGSIRTTINVKTGNYLDIGICNLSQLPKYWRIINYGGLISPKARHITGYFVGGTGGRFPSRGGKGGVFRFTGKGGYGKMMNVKKPIQGKFFIEKTLVATFLMVNKVNRKLGKIFGQNVGLTGRLESRLPEFNNIGKVKYKK